MILHLQGPIFIFMGPFFAMMQQKLCTVYRAFQFFPFLGQHFVFPGSFLSNLHAVFPFLGPCLACPGSFSSSLHVVFPFLGHKFCISGVLFIKSPCSFPIPGSQVLHFQGPKTIIPRSKVLHFRGPTQHELCM